ncbi:MAG: hypothetical protein R3D57_07210 [Hyphomicrobiaceae bacterium]
MTGRTVQRYRLTADDLPFAAEFLASPIGYKSPGLQRILNLMRSTGPEGKYVLICKRPHKTWGLGRMPSARGRPIEEIVGVIYTNLIDAERDVFLRRWHDLGGPPLAERG